MSTIKHTKGELKAQRDALKRYERFLPMLQLKKQQLQVEIQTIDTALEEKADHEARHRAELQCWIKLFAEDIPIDGMIRIGEVEKSENNIAGVSIPVLDTIRFERKPVDLFETPPWVDDGLQMLELLLHLRVEIEILREQHRRINEELRKTAQRVNLFEKIKIPEAHDNIRVIKIFLGDQQTAGVARAKTAKNKLRLAEMQLVDEPQAMGGAA